MTQAALMIIGNEILSGRTQDTNLNWLAKALNEIGIQLREVRVVPDVEGEIIAAAHALRVRFDYVFTTGGIGPTHDDITSASIAKAFGVRLLRHPEAEAILTRHYGPENLNEARLKMADIPEGATLIANPVSSAPGFQLENVLVMAGVPRIMQAMFDGVKHRLQGGAKVLARTLTLDLAEGVIAAALAEVQGAFADVEMGSYPFMQQGKLGTSLVLRSADRARLVEAGDALKARLAAMGATVGDDFV